MDNKVIEIKEMQKGDYDLVYEFWKNAEGIKLSEADEWENINLFLNRNPKMSFVARHNNRVVGTILAGHDGRRGYLHHLVVASEYRNHGIGSILVEKALARIKAEGITKCHIFVLPDNSAALAFWQAVGWKKRNWDEIAMCTKVL